MRCSSDVGGDGRTGFLLPGSPFHFLTGNAVALFGDGVSRLIEHFFDLRERHDLGVVVDMNRFARDIDLDLTYAVQVANGPFNGVLAMLARNVGGHKCRRFHDSYPPLIQPNHLVKSKQESSSLNAAKAASSTRKG